MDPHSTDMTLHSSNTKMGLNAILTSTSRGNVEKKRILDPVLVKLSHFYPIKKKKIYPDLKQKNVEVPAKQ